MDISPSLLERPTLLEGVLVLTAVWTLYTAYLHLSDPLRAVPGPWPARFTRLWELLQVHRGHFEQVNVDLHRRFGPVVRIAPNRYSISSPEALKPVYGSGSQFAKDAWYRPFGHPDEAQADLFSTTDVHRHATTRRKFASLYSMSSIVTYESVVNATSDQLLRKFSHFATTNETIDLPTWIQFYAFDVIGEITCGKSFGLMSEGVDADGILHTIHQSLTYSSHVSLYHELHPWIDFFSRMVGRRNPLENIVAYILRQLAEHQQDSSRPNDFTAKLLALQKNEKLEDADVFRAVFANIAAGSDTTAVTISAAIYYLARNKRCLERLREEIAAAHSQGTISRPISFAEAQQLPYLQAVIKETFRLHPAVGQMLARVVPRGGSELVGYHFPAGTVVGINAWAIHQDQAVFGDDADSFNPDRWLGAKDAVAAMERTLFMFGAGARVCIGRHISTLEMTKLIPRLIEEFDFTPQGDEWKTENVFFVKPSFDCRIATRLKT